MTATLLDLRGMRCPWPALRVARALREADDATTILAVADDPLAPSEIDAVASARGWRATTAETALGPGLAIRRID